MGASKLAFRSKLLLVLACIALLSISSSLAAVNPDQLALLVQIRRETPELAEYWTDEALTRACNPKQPLFGIKACTEDGWVTVIELITWREIRFTLAPSMAKMPALLSLNIELVNGTLPEAWGNMFNLQQLRLGGIIGESRVIPSSWEGMKSLKNLTLASRELKSASYEALFGASGSIEDSLHLEAKMIAERGDDMIGGAKEKNTKLESPKTRSGRRDEPPIVNFPETIADMRSLENLWIEGAWYSGTIPASLSKLTRAGFAFMPMSGGIPDTFARSKSLVSIYLLQLKLNQPMPSDWSEAENLRVLRLLQLPIGGSLPERFPKRLKWFVAEILELTGTIAPALLHETPELEYFDVNFNKIEGTIPSPLPSNPKLYLVLNTNRFTGTIPNTIYGIRGIDVNNNYGLVGTIPRFSELPAGFNCTIQTMEIWSVQYMQGTLPDDLERCTALKTLNFGFSKFTGTIPSIYAHLPNLATLEAGGNQLTGSIPDGPWPALDRLSIFQNLNISGTIPTNILKRSLGVLEVGYNYINICGNTYIRDNRVFIRFICSLTPQYFYASVCWCKPQWPSMCRFSDC